VAYCRRGAEGRKIPMKVGVFFPGSPPTVGGGHTFEQEVLRSLLELSMESAHEFFLYFGMEYADTSQPLPATKNLQSKWLDLRDYVSARRMFLLKTAQKFRFIRRWVIAPKILQLSAQKDHAQLMWFPTPVSLPVEIPYIATMYDIQHRLQPWFPEVSQKGVWDFREDYFSSYLRRATYIITPNQTGQDELTFFYQIPSEHFRQLPHFVPRITQLPSQNEISSILKKYGISSPYLFYPAQFWAHKNHVNLLKALNILREQYKIDLDLVLTGYDKGNLQYVKSVVERLHLQEHIYFLDFVPRQDLIVLYAGAFALTYVTYFGPENLPPLEAFACGCPVIASDVPGAAEQFGGAVLRVNPSQPGEIASAVKKLHEDGQLRAIMIEKGLARAQGFNSCDYVRAVFKMIDEFESIRINWE
jgi:glycosyltransferase involved in cell wall biosynthesis